MIIIACQHSIENFSALLFLLQEYASSGALPSGPSTCENQLAAMKGKILLADGRPCGDATTCTHAPA